MWIWGLRICGACFQLQCVDDLRWCFPGTHILWLLSLIFVLQIMGSLLIGGGKCNPPNKHFIAIWKAANMPIQYRRLLKFSVAVFKMIKCRRDGGIRCLLSLASGLFSLSVLDFPAMLQGLENVTAVKIKGSRNRGNQALSFEVTSSERMTVISYNVASQRLEIWDRPLRGQQFET
ncbi:hypothetical protein NC652_010879 [Populus alba x Populus x berolinensis]|nr:hypothetical protein NC652_010879 [Populus alba x Populus x berolinensis]